MSDFRGMLEDEASLFSLATEYLEAAAILARAPILKINVSLVTLSLLGHAAELFFKSLLYTSSLPVKDLKAGYGHNLSKLLQKAGELGQLSSKDFPQVEGLSKLYSSKSTEYRKNQAIALPSQELLLVELRNIERIAYSHVSSFSA